MPKYWGRNYFAHGRFPKVGQKQKTEKKLKKINKNRKLHLNYTSSLSFGPGGLRWPWVLACAMRSLAIVITQYFGITGRYMHQKMNFLRPAFVHGRMGHPQSLEYLSFFFSPFFAFDPLRGISHVRNNFSPNILV